MHLFIIFCEQAFKRVWTVMSKGTLFRKRKGKLEVAFLSGKSVGR